ncbi:MAG: GGDEF domain-containing protein [Planctomycetota bacterium]|jgi:diguanylate cyclase
MIIYILAGSIAVLVISSMYIFRKKKSESTGEGKVKGRKASLQDISLPKVDPREQKIEDSAEKLRGILRTLADVVSNVDSAADDSSSALDEAKVRISNIKASQYLEEAAILLDQIDNVISSNNSLKSELNKSRKEIKNQQERIHDLNTAVRIDSLTELANRSALKEVVSACLKNMHKDGETFSLMMIDIDHFKEINDSFGHVAGDRILKGFSNKLKANIRSSDFVSRYGGEEFAVIVLKAGLEQAAIIAEELRSSIASSKFIIDETKVKVTVSIGVAEALTGDSMESLVDRADKALYSAKEGGRNKVCTFEKEPEKTD